MLRVVALASLLAVACTDDGSGPTGTSHTEQKQVEFGFAPELDLLFVVDSSPASATYRQMLVDQAADLADALTTDEGTPSLHIGVVESGCDGADGRLRTDPTITGPFISDVPAADGSRVHNYQGTLVDALGRLLDVTASDCATTLPLDAAQQVLDNTVDNADFWRTDAYFAVVFVTAQDDSASASVETFAADLKARKSDPAKIRVAGVIAPTPSTCAAQATPRLHAFLDLFPDRHAETSICDAHYADAVSSFGYYSKPLGVACWESPLADADPATPGTQPSCTAQYLLVDQTEGVLPECTDDNGLCWRNVSDAANCPSGFGPRIDTRGTMYPYGSTVTLDCLVAD
jgi:hypothetical protein